MVRVPSKPADRTKTPGTLKEVLHGNVRRQQRRSEVTQTPPEARRPPRKRVKTASRKGRRP